MTHWYMRSLMAQAASFLRFWMSSILARKPSIIGVNDGEPGAVMIRGGTKCCQRGEKRWDVGRGGELVRAAREAGPAKCAKNQNLPGCPILDHHQEKKKFTKLGPFFCAEKWLARYIAIRGGQGPSQGGLGHGPAKIQLATN
jgi:hypothetical protein